MVSIQGSCLKLLRVAYAFCLPSLSLPILVRLFSRGGLGLYLYLYLFHCARIFNSLKIYAKILACIGLHIPFPKDMCTGFVFFFFLAGMGFMPTYLVLGGYVHKLYILFFQLVQDLCMYIQFPKDICTNGLGVLTYKEVLGERSTRENDLLRSVLMTH